jgi:error-prone DNA polymerase
MPDPPPGKRTYPLPLVRGARGAAPAVAYAELHAKSNFSFLEGASHPDELAARAAELGYRALAVTDRHSLAGVVRAHVAAKEAGLKLLIGAEIWPLDAPPVVLLATDRASYGRLSRLITCGRRRAPKGECHLTLSDVAEHAEGLVALCVLGEMESGARNSERGTRNEGDDALAVGSRLNGSRTESFPIRAPRSEFRVLSSVLSRYREIFSDRCYALAELHRGPDDARQLDEWAARAAKARLPLVAANDVYFHARKRRALADVLAAVRLGCTVAEAGPRLMANAERYLKSPADMAMLFARVPAALARTVEVADRCTFSLDELRYEYPEELCPPGATPIEHLTRLAWRGAGKRYPKGIPEKVRRLVEHELRLIEELRYEAYFLTVWDLVRFARGRDILCQGRGSAANSAVCYCLGVTSVDPQRMDVLFERFVSRERNEAPDIDIDFEHERREEVLQYLYEKYGRQRAGLTAEVITYRPRSAVRDVGKALGLSPDRVDALAKAIDGHTDDVDWDSRLRDAGLDPAAPLVRRLSELTGQLIGFPRHLSQHVGGMVITRGPLWELAPIENAAMADRTVIQWDKDDLDELGILKVDCLALGMLTAIRKCFQFIERHHGRRLSLATVPPGDRDVYRMISRADTMGVFQIESRAQMSMLPRLRPRTFYDLVIEVAIVRPGPIQGNMVHPYLRRRAGLEPVEYPNDEIRAVLEKTMGVPIFQEQAMRLAVVAAGFTPGEADQLRRAMGGWRRPGLIEQFRQKLIAGMLARGLPEEYAQCVFQQIRGFGEYGFPESHAASFALLVYVSAWLKHYYPAAFAAALLNSQPMGFYAPAQLVRDAREHGVEVRPPDVNHSDWDCTLEEGGGRKPEFGTGSAERGIRNGKQSSRNVRRWLAAKQRVDGTDSAPSSEFRVPSSTLRLGLRMLAGLPAATVEAIVAARGADPFQSLDDFVRRTGLTQAMLVRLAKADALGSLGLNRRTALWESLAREKKARSLPLFDELEAARAATTPLATESPAAADVPANLPPLAAFEEVLADYRTVGLSLRGHPMKFFRSALDRLRVAPAGQLAVIPSGRYVRVAGLVLVRQRPGTAKGITFVTLEDETGVANLIIRPDVWQRFRKAAKNAAALLAHGRLERRSEVTHILVARLEDLAEVSDVLPAKSRDFR